jgi:hypothetical protein
LIYKPLPVSPIMHRQMVTSNMPFLCSDRDSLYTRPDVFPSAHVIDTSTGADIAFPEPRHWCSKYFTSTPNLGAAAHPHAHFFFPCLSEPKMPPRAAMQRIYRYIVNATGTAPLHSHLTASGLPVELVVHLRHAGFDIVVVEDLRIPAAMRG